MCPPLARRACLSPGRRSGKPPRLQQHRQSIVPRPDFRRCPPRASQALKHHSHRPSSLLWCRKCSALTTHVTSRTRSNNSRNGWSLHSACIPPPPGNVGLSLLRRSVGEGTFGHPRACSALAHRLPLHRPAPHPTQSVLAQPAQALAASWKMTTSCSSRTHSVREPASPPRCFIPVKVLPLHGR